MQVLDHFPRILRLQWSAAVHVVAQCQCPVTSHVDVVDLDVGLQVAEVVAGKEGLAQGLVTPLVVNRRDFPEEDSSVESRIE